jgi:hypothetical protein
MALYEYRNGQIGPVCLQGGAQDLFRSNSVVDDKILSLNGRWVASV